MYNRHIFILLGSLAITACSKPMPVEIPFELTYHGQPISCDKPVDSVSLRDFRFYLHDIQAKDSANQWQTLTLSKDGQWQNGETVLIDLEDAKAPCSGGNIITNNRIIGSLPKGDYSALRFTLGVPFENNHQNPLTADAPLNESSMHWHWQSGYKFLRAEFAYNEGPRRIHLGSLHCQGEIDNITHCESPNRPTITLDGFEPGKDKVNIALDGLFDHPAQQDAPKVTCMGDDEKPWCDNSLQWIGLGDKTQSAFKLAGAAE